MKIYIVTMDTKWEGSEVVGLRRTQTKARRLAAAHAQKPLTWVYDRARRTSRAETDWAEAYVIRPYELE